MTRLDFPDYLAHLRRESQRFRDVLAGCRPDLPVPSCPAWNTSDLLWHLGRVQWFWAATVRRRPHAPDGTGPEPQRPGAHEELLAFFDESSAALVDELERADPADEAWTWADEQTVGFTFRRQAHEALIHRVDAELAAGGAATALDPALASDGVLEALDVMFGGAPPWGEFRPLAHAVRVECADTGDSTWVQLGRVVGTDPVSGLDHDDPGIDVVPDPGTDADAVVEGPAGALDAWLWRRGDDSEIRVHGDRRIYDRFRLAVNHPLN